MRLDFLSVGKRLSSQVVQLAGGCILLDLPIPGMPIEHRKPLAEILPAPKAVAIPPHAQST